MTTESLVSPTRLCRTCGKLTTVKTGIFIGGQWYCSAQCHNRKEKTDETCTRLDCASDTLPPGPRE